MPSNEPAGRQEGVLADWNDERGFGFITPTGGGPRVFAHVSAFPRSRRPAPGCSVTYALAWDERNRPRASGVQYLRPLRTSHRDPTGILLALATATLFFVSLAGLVVINAASGWLLALYAGFSVFAFGIYAGDKSAAQQGTWRTSESTLHLLALVGGWPGALVARQVLRHKTTKQPFRTVFWITVVANCAALGWWLVSGVSLTLS